jgi:hypothetical protein
MAVLPMFHVTGMQDMYATIQSGGTVVLLTRWDRACASRQIERAGVTTFAAITTMRLPLKSGPRPPRLLLDHVAGRGWRGDAGGRGAEARDPVRQT